MFNDYWMIDQGFIERDRKGDLRDLISRRHEESGTVTVSADDNLLIAYGRMKLYDISQLPVLDSDGKVVGIIDEGDILLKVFHDDSRFKDPISSAMTSRLETIEADQPMEALLPIFAKDNVPKIGRAHVLTPVTTAHLVCRLLLEKNKHTTQQ